MKQHFLALAAVLILVLALALVNGQKQKRTNKNKKNKQKQKKNTRGGSTNNKNARQQNKKNDVSGTLAAAAIKLTCTGKGTGSDAWCTSSCNNVPSFCPADLCDCNEDGIATTAAPSSTSTTTTRTAAPTTSTTTTSTTTTSTTTTTTQAPRSSFAVPRFGHPEPSTEEYFMKQSEITLPSMTTALSLPAAFGDTLVYQYSNATGTQAECGLTHEKPILDINACADLATTFSELFGCHILSLYQVGHLFLLSYPLFPSLRFSLPFSLLPFFISSLHLSSSIFSTRKMCSLSIRHKPAWLHNLRNSATCSIRS